MQIILTMALYNYKVQVIIKTTSHSVLVITGKLSKYFPGCGNPDLRKPPCLAGVSNEQLFEGHNQIIPISKLNSYPRSVVLIFEYGSWQILMLRSLIC